MIYRLVLIFSVFLCTTPLVCAGNCEKSDLIGVWEHQSLKASIGLEEKRALVVRSNMNYGLEGFHYVFVSRIAANRTPIENEFYNSKIDLIHRFDSEVIQQSSLFPFSYLAEIKCEMDPSKSFLTLESRIDQKALQKSPGLQSRLHNSKRIYRRVDQLKELSKLMSVNDHQPFGLALKVGWSSLYNVTSREIELDRDIKSLNLKAGIVLCEIKKRTFGVLQILFDKDTFSFSGVVTLQSQEAVKILIPSLEKRSQEINPELLTSSFRKCKKEDNNSTWQLHHGTENGVFVAVTSNYERLNYNALAYLIPVSDERIVKAYLPPLLAGVDEAPLEFKWKSFDVKPDMEWKF